MFYTTLHELITSIADVIM